jgi:hypothetical protein
MLLGESGAWFGTSVDLVWKSSRFHEDGSFHWTHGVTNSTTSTIFLNDSWNCIVSVKLNSLVTRVRASQVASATLETLVVIDDWCLELSLRHFFNGRDVS